MELSVEDLVEEEAPTEEEIGASTELLGNLNFLNGYALYPGSQLDFKPAAKRMYAYFKLGTDSRYQALPTKLKC